MEDQTFPLPPPPHPTPLYLTGQGILLLCAYFRAIAGFQTAAFIRIDTKRSHLNVGRTKPWPWAHIFATPVHFDGLEGNSGPEFPFLGNRASDTRRPNLPFCGNRWRLSLEPRWPENGCTATCSTSSAHRCVHWRVLSC